MMIDRLPTIAEAIKLTCFGPETMRLDGKLSIIKDEFIRYDADILYEVVGAFVENDYVKVIAKIHSINCHELIENYVINIFQKRLQDIIIKKIPEAKGHIVIGLIKKFLNEE